MTLCIERFLPDGGETGSDRQAGQSGAVFERLKLDGGDTVGDRQAGQAVAVEERSGPDGDNGARDRYTGHAGGVVVLTQSKKTPGTKKVWDSLTHNQGHRRELAFR